MRDGMATRRTKSISTKVTDAEYDAIASRAEPQTVSAWARGILVSTAQPDPLHLVLLAEMLALRTIMLNLQYTLAANHPLSEDAMHRLIEHYKQTYPDADEQLTRDHRGHVPAAPPVVDNLNNKVVVRLLDRPDRHRGSGLVHSRHQLGKMV